VVVSFDVEGEYQRLRQKDAEGAKIRAREQFNRQAWSESEGSLIMLAVEKRKREATCEKRHAERF
jgi:hypothetical protein